MPWQLDPTHSSIEFRGKHMLVSTVRGRFNEFKSDLAINDEDFVKSGATFRITTASLESGFDQRDDHLRSPDFFDAERYPEITFETTDIERIGDDGRYRFNGNLTIRDVTRPVVFEGEAAGPVDDPWGSTRIALSARAEINRKDWGLDWNLPLGMSGMLVSDAITLSIDAELVKAA